MAGGLYVITSLLLLGAGPDGGYQYPPLLPSQAAPPVQQSVPYHDTAVVGSSVADERTAYTTGGLYGEPLYPYDSQYPWMHGYFQEIPPYAGFRAFRPYNFRHVLSQSQVSGGWGMSPKMPYSQQFWHKYQERAAMRRRLTAEVPGHEQVEASPASRQATHQRVRPAAAIDRNVSYGPSTDARPAYGRYPPAAQSPYGSQRNVSPPSISSAQGPLILPPR